MDVRSFPFVRCGWLRRGIVAGLLFACMHLWSGCLEDDRVDPWQAQLRIGIATTAKYSQCDQEGGFYLPVFGSPKETDLRRCEEAILAASCPFKAELPLFCLNLYTGGAL